MYMTALSAYRYVYHVYALFPQISEPSGLELQEIVRCPKWVLETKLGPLQEKLLTVEPYLYSPVEFFFFDQENSFKNDQTIENSTYFTN